MTTITRSHPLEQLHDVLHRYRRLQAEHRAEHAGGSRRRRDEHLLTELEQRFDLLLTRWVHRERERDEWRHALHHGATAPELPRWTGPLLFRGRSATGTTLELRHGAGDEALAYVDGTLRQRFVRAPDIGSSGAMPFDGETFDEAFAISSTAGEALRAFAAREVQAPPWPWALELFADGLIDGDFSLTRRGHRFVASGGSR